MSSNIIQWNCRGIKANYNEILLLLSKFNPSLVCLSETFLKESDKISFKNYSMYNHIDKNQSKASGGTSIIINNNCPPRQIGLDTNIQSIAVNVTLHRPITFCSIYLPPKSKITHEDLDHLFKQLPHPYFLVGDLMVVMKFGVALAATPKVKL